MQSALSKVPAVTLGFWVIKILATTLGETGGDTVSMTWLGETTPEAGQGGLNGYLVGTGLFGVLLAVLVFFQIRAKRFNPWLYWATIIASTTTGTTGSRTRRRTTTFIPTSTCCSTTSPTRRAGSTRSR